MALWRGSCITSFRRISKPSSNMVGLFWGSLILPPTTSWSLMVLRTFSGIIFVLERLMYILNFYEFMWLPSPESSSFESDVFKFISRSPPSEILLKCAKRSRAGALQITGTAALFVETFIYGYRYSKQKVQFLRTSDPFLGEPIRKIGSCIAGFCNIWKLTGSENPDEIKKWRTTLSRISHIDSSHMIVHVSSSRLLAYI